MKDYLRISDDELTDWIATHLKWIPSNMGHGFYSTERSIEPVLFGPTHITQHFFEACQSAGIERGKYHRENEQWVHELIKGEKSSVAVHDNFLRAGCIALAQFLDLENDEPRQEMAI